MVGGPMFEPKVFRSKYTVLKKVLVTLLGIFSCQQKSPARAISLLAEPDWLNAGAISPLAEPDWLNWSHDKDCILGLAYHLCHVT